MASDMYYPDMIKTSYGIAMPIYLKYVRADSAKESLGYTLEALRYLNCERYEVLIGHTGEGSSKSLISPDRWCVLIKLYHPSNARTTWHKDKIDELKERLDNIFVTESGSPVLGPQRGIDEEGFVSGASSPVGKVLTRWHPKRIVDGIQAHHNAENIRKLPWRYLSKVVVYDDVPMLLSLASMVQQEDLAACTELLRYVHAKNDTQTTYCVNRLRKSQTWEDLYKRLGHSVPTFASGAANASGSANVNAIVITRPKSSLSRSASSRAESPTLQRPVESPTLVERKVDSPTLQQRRETYALEPPQPEPSSIPQRRVDSSTLTSQRKPTYAEPPQPEPESYYSSYQVESPLSQRRFSHVQVESPPPTSHPQRRMSAFEPAFDFEDFPLELEPMLPEPMGSLQTRRMSTATKSSRRQSQQPWDEQVTSQPRQSHVQSQSRPGSSQLHRMDMTSPTPLSSLKRERRNSTITINIRMNK
ncbi:hypothetical protein BDV06DRAFT_227846 [Aspergillus oleicola]